MCTTSLPSNCGGQKIASDSLLLEFEMAVRQHVYSGNEIQVLSKSNKFSKPLSHLSSLPLLYTLLITEYLQENSIKELTWVTEIKI